MFNSLTSKAFAALKKPRSCLDYLAANSVLDSPFAARRSVPTLRRLQDFAKPQLRGIIENPGALVQRWYRELTLALYIVAIERS